MSAFIICWLPFFVLALVRPFVKGKKPWSYQSMSVHKSKSIKFFWMSLATRVALVCGVPSHHRCRWCTIACNILLDTLFCPFHRTNFNYIPYLMQSSFPVLAEIPGWITSLFLWLGYANSALNPVIYATLNRDFRRPFREILCFRCSTLDDLMRREFYDHQYGGDEYYIRNKKKHVGTDSGVNSVCGRTSSKQYTADQLQLPNYQHTLSSPSQNTITTSTAIIRGSPWTTSNRKTFETQLTTDPETDVDMEGDVGEGVSWTSG